MCSIHTEVLEPKHPYTRSKTPWIIAAPRKSPYGKLVHYLSGGGMRVFGRTVHQEEVRSRQRRFLAFAAVLGVLWIVFYVI